MRGSRENILFLALYILGERNELAVQLWLEGPVIELLVALLSPLKKNLRCIDVHDICYVEMCLLYLCIYMLVLWKTLR